MTTIMAVDDNKDILNTEVMILTKSGYSVQTAVSGQDFLSKLETASEKPQVVLLDVMMPGLTTHEILEKIIEKKETCKVILVTVVRFSDEELSVLKTKYGVVDYVAKPFDIFDLLSTIKKHLPSKEV